MIFASLTLGLLLQAVQAAPPPSAPANSTGAREALPVLAFPEPGMDDPAAYQGYQTRFYRDAKGNTVQIYLAPQSGRVVNLWADAANESVGFTVRDARGRPVRVSWADDAAEVSESGAARTIAYRLTADAAQVEVGWFLLGSMRVERDFQYWRDHLRPYAAAPFQVAEESLLAANVARLPPAERQQHLGLLGASSVAELRARLQPKLTVARTAAGWCVRVLQPSLDGQHHLALELRGDMQHTTVQPTARTVVIRSRSGAPAQLSVRLTTDAAPLTPLARDEIFAPEFLAFVASARAAHDSVLRAAGPSPHGTDSVTVARYRRLEREVRGVELLSSAEKLMAGLPAFATYFGRDMLMTALMMQPIWKGTMLEHVIASVLRKLSPEGDVSHEEALGGQAIRESAAEYNALLSDYFRLASRGRRASADSVLGRARDVLRHAAVVRENYHMIDDDFQLPIVVARYLADSAVPPERKRAFLRDTSIASTPRVTLLLREMALVATRTRPYADAPSALTLVSFVKRDSTHWRSASWRDSDAGYGNGRFAMDVNAIWAPRALESIRQIAGSLRALGYTREMLDSLAPELARSPLGEYLADSTALRRAIETWAGARRHFQVTLRQREMQDRIDAKLAWLPPDARRYWTQTLKAQGGVPDSLVFLALSLDSAGHPIPLVNSDPAADLFLDDASATIVGATHTPAEILREVDPFVRPYPVGLFIAGLGPVAVNDAFASRKIWETFAKDQYHSPQVVWGREVNLLLLGLANRIAAAYDASGRLRDPALAPYVQSLHDALERTRAAVAASGFEHSELWSYRVEGGKLLPTRYGTGSDVQLWSSTDLAVQFALARLPAP
ncbi:MAG TPA: hypothetical protein VFS33_08790 [Gemmatimonadales bacterium]|nr:hypothetical protein [Gemmatimonadales bacterium]